MKRSTYLTFNAENAIFKVPPTQLQGEWVVLQRSSGEFQSTRRKMILQLALGTEWELNCKNGTTNAGAVHISRLFPRSDCVRKMAESFDYAYRNSYVRFGDRVLTLTIFCFWKRKTTFRPNYSEETSIFSKTDTNTANAMQALIFRNSRSVLAKFGATVRQ